MRRDIDTAVAELAKSQYGVWTFAQAERRGASRALASRRTLSGLWVRKHPEVYVHPGWVPSPEGEAMAAAWSLRGGVASGPCAAHLQGVEGARPCPTEVTVPRGAQQPRPFVVRQSSWLPAGDTTAMRKVPCTSLPRTLVDLGDVWAERRLSDAWSEAIRSRRTTIGRLQDTAVPLLGRGHPGTRLVRRQLERHADTDPASESELEVLLQEVIEGGGYGPMTRQMPLGELCHLSGRCDGYLPHVCLVVEADGRRWHTRVEDFERDRARDNELLAAGIHVARFSHHRLVHERAEVFRVLDAHFTRRGFVRDGGGLWLPAALGAA